MAWCMTASSVEVDVVFVENASIGQKIKIGESIERALETEIVVTVDTTDAEDVAEGDGDSATQTTEGEDA